MGKRNIPRILDIVSFQRTLQPSIFFGMVAAPLIRRSFSWKRYSSGRASIGDGSKCDAKMDDHAPTSEEGSDPSTPSDSPRPNNIIWSSTVPQENTGPLGIHGWLLKKHSHKKHVTSQWARRFFVL